MEKKTNVVLKKWKKSRREEYRVVLGEYRGKKNLSLRIWYCADDGTFKPGRTGINLGVDQWDNLFNGMRRARRKARKLGLIGRRSRRAKKQV